MIDRDFIKAKTYSFQQTSAFDANLQSNAMIASKQLPQIPSEVMQTRNQMSSGTYVERVSIKSEYQAQAYEAKSQSETYY